MAGSAVHKAVVRIFSCAPLLVPSQTDGSKYLYEQHLQYSVPSPDQSLGANLPRTRFSRARRRQGIGTGLAAAEILGVAGDGDVLGEGAR